MRPTHLSPKAPRDRGGTAGVSTAKPGPAKLVTDAVRHAYLPRVVAAGTLARAGPVFTLGPGRLELDPGLNLVLERVVDASTAVAAAVNRGLEYIPRAFEALPPSQERIPSSETAVPAGQGPLEGGNE